MLVQVLDAQGLPHWVTWQGQDQIDDFSGSLGASAVGPAAVPQVVAPANPNLGTTGALGRAGFLFRNTSANPMLLTEIAVTTESVSAWTVYPGEYFPPPGCAYPVPTGAISVQGSPASVLGDAFVYREWVNAAGE
jgi:hypothetical protein